MAPTIDLTTLQAAFASLRVDVDAILEIMGTNPESTPIDLAKDMVLYALFRHIVEPPFEQRVHSKRQHSIHSTKVGDGACAKKSERLDLEWARRASLTDKELSAESTGDSFWGILFSTCDW